MNRIDEPQTSLLSASIRCLQAWALAPGGMEVLKLEQDHVSLGGLREGNVGIGSIESWVRFRRTGT